MTTQTRNAHSPKPPTLGEASMPDGITSYRLAERGPQRSGEVGHRETGRAVSARNATTHGLFARDVVLPTLGEDPAAFDALLVQLCTQLPPRNLLERHYLEQIAAASWRLRRLHRWQAQVYEDDTIDEDARLGKLDKTLRHETMLTRQIDRAVRLLGHDLTDLFADRAREDTLAKLGRTEAECHATLGLAAQVERIARRAVQATADEPPLIDGLDPNRLDNVHVPTPREICKNENGENEPPVAAPNIPFKGDPSPCGSARAEAGKKGHPSAAKKCENEPVAPSPHTPPLLGAGGPPKPPMIGGCGEVGTVAAGREVSDDPDYLPRCFLTGQQYRRPKIAETDAPKTSKRTEP